MAEVVSVRFKNKGKVYYFDPNGLSVRQGQNVIVDTAKGLEYAECAVGNHEVPDESVRAPLRPVLRVATAEDERRAEANRAAEKDAFRIGREKIRAHKLDMKLVDVEYNFEGSKILFFFTSDDRVDFRELVKDLAGVFHTRIELRQIGVRDEARMLGGLGICGLPYCCSQFLDDLQHVTIKMAKTQGFSLNPTKISGACGRLMCCLKYEEAAYEELVKHVPSADSFVDTPAGKGTVLDNNLLKSTVRVRLEDAQEMTIKTFSADDVTVLGGKQKRAEYLQMRAEGRLQEEKPAPRVKRLDKPAESAAEPSREKQHNPRHRPHETHRIKAEIEERPAEKPAQAAEKQEKTEKPYASHNRRFRRRRPQGGEKPHGGE